MVFTRKFSEFVPGTVDETVGLTGGANTIGPSGGGGGGGSVIEIITQPTGALSVGDWVRFDDGTQLYVPGLATTSQFAEIAGVVLNILSGTQFELQQSGYINHGTPGFSGFNTSSTYFLSDSMSGAMTQTPPTDNGHIRLPLFIADSTDSGWVASLKTGMVIGSPGPIPSGGGGGGSDPSIHIVNQPGNGFSIGDWVYVSGDTTYSLASGATFATSQGVGVVIASGNPLFTIQFSGFNSNTITGAVNAIGNPLAIVSGGVYYLSDVIPGAISPVAPTAVNHSVKPCYISESSSMLTGYVLPQEPVEVMPGANDPSVVEVHQVNHMFNVPDVIRVLASGTYVKALGDTLPDSRAVGIVVQIIDADNFILQTSGYSAVFSGLTPAAQYYLSDVTPGLLTLTEPVTIGHASKPMLAALTATSGYILEQRPLLQPNANGGGGGAGGGGVIGNLVQTVYSTSFSLGGAAVDFPFNVVITPSSNTNRIKITYSGAITAGGSFNLVLKRNGVVLNQGSTFVGVRSSLTTCGHSFTYIDSPSTTSAVTYNISLSAPVGPGALTYTNSPAFMIPLVLIAEEIGSLPLPPSMPSNIIQTIFFNNTGITMLITGDLDPSLNITITPSSASSRIRLMVGGNLALSNSLAGLNQLLIKRNGALIPLSTGFASFGAAVSHGAYIDTPATSSPITYSLYSGRITDGSAQQSGLGQSSSINFIAEEIGAVGSFVGGSGADMGYVSTYWYPSGSTFGGTGISLHATNRTTGTLYYHPIFITHTATFTNIGVLLGATAAGTSVLGIYNDNGNGAPTGNPITNSNSGNIANIGNTFISFTFGVPITLTAGVYWLAHSSSGVTGFTGPANTSGSSIGGRGLGINTTPSLANIPAPAIGWSQAFVYSATLPAVGALTSTTAYLTGDVFIFLQAQ